MENEVKNNYYTLITGATGGLGKAFCTEVARLGHNLFITGTSDDRLSQFREELLKQYPNTIIKYKACDLSNYNSRNELLETLEKDNIRVNYLINNAGLITEGSIQNSNIDTILKCIQVNCEGTIHITKKLLDIKPKSEKFDIVCITSMAANYPMPYMAIYASTKSLLKNFMIALRHEYKKDNVRVLIVEPGAIATSQEMKDAIASQGLKGRLSSVPPEIIARKSLKCATRRKSRCIPGFFNKMTIFVSNLAPTALKTKFIAKMWRKSQDKRNIK